jgi:hypothetical protein
MTGEATHTDAALLDAAAWIAHRLAGYAAALDAKSSEDVVEALTGAEVTFRATGPFVSEQVREFYASAFASDKRRTCHVPGLPATTWNGDGVAFEAPYLRFDADAATPVLEAVSHYRGQIVREGSTWRWSRFIVAAD